MEVPHRSGLTLLATLGVTFSKRFCAKATGQTRIPVSCMVVHVVSVALPGYAQIPNSEIPSELMLQALGAGRGRGCLLAVDI